MENFLSSLGFNNINELLVISNGTLRIIVILAIAAVLMKFSTKGILTLKAHLKKQSSEDYEEIKRIDTLCRVFRYTITVLISVITVVEILNELGISIAPMLAAAGVVGLAVGFGAQSLIKDYFNGFFILIENQIRQGDVVDAGGKAGLVEEVTLRYIRMRDYDGNVHYVPNGNITTVTNMSRGFAQSVIDVGIAYREDIDFVMQMMQQVGEELQNDEAYQSKILSPMEMAGVEKLDHSAVVIRCRFKVLPLEQWGVRREYLKRIKAVFDERGIEIPYPHLTIYPGQNRDGTAPALRIAKI